MIARVRQWLWPLAGLVVTLTWAVAALYDEPRPRVAAAAVAALVTATVVPTTLESLLAAAVLLGLFPLSMTRPALLAAAVVVVAAVELAADRRIERLLSLAGAGLVAASVVPSGDPTSAIALAGAFLLLAGPSPMLMVPGLFVASLAAGHLPPDETAVACALAAVGLAAFVRHGPAAAALGIVGSPLLLAGVLVRQRAATLALLPGAVALVGALSMEELTVRSGALAAGLAAVAALIAWRGQPVTSPAPRDLPVYVLLAWLALAPESWGRVGPVDLGPYQRGIAIAAASGGIALVATNVLRSRHGLSSSTS